MDEAKGGNHVFSVDLAAQTVTAPSGKSFRFEIDPARKEKLLKGLDSIGETLQHAADIDAYEAAARSRSPGWSARDADRRRDGPRAACERRCACARTWRR